MARSLPAPKVVMPASLADTPVAEAQPQSSEPEFPAFNAAAKASPLFAAPLRTHGVIV